MSETLMEIAEKNLQEYIIEYSLQAIRLRKIKNLKD